MNNWQLDECKFFVSTKAWSVVPPSLQKAFAVVWREQPKVPDGVTPCVFVFASEVIGTNAERLPARLLGPDSRYAIVIDDVPLATLVDIPDALNLHKPDLRIHWTQNAEIVRRAIVSQLRDQRLDAILDAYVFEEKLTLVLADLGKRVVDIADIPSLKKLKRNSLMSFEIDENGSYLHWRNSDVHLGVSQILQAIDPEYLAQIEIDRNALDYTGWAIQLWRKELRLKQSDIEGLSERHVRRIEQGVSRLTSAAAGHFARAFGMTTKGFLDELATRTRKTREEVERETAADKDEKRAIVVFELAA